MRVIPLLSQFKNAEVSTGGIAVKSGNIGDVLEVKTKEVVKLLGILKKKN